jgi:hypothetical protein
LHPNRRFPGIILICSWLATTAAILLAFSGPASAELREVPDRFAAEFSATVKPDIKGDLDLDIKGSVSHSYPMTRIEFIHPLTMEQIILIIDGEERLATLLYPDTLNGFSFRYDGRYYAEWPDGFVGYLSTDADDHPGGWSKAVTGSDKDASVEVALRKDGYEVVCELNSEGQPSVLQVITPKHSAVLSFSNYVFPEELDGSLFAIPPDFAIEQVSDLEDDAALPL